MNQKSFRFLRGEAGKKSNSKLSLEENKKPSLDEEGGGKKLIRN